ncbi:MAG: hypothetical protein HYZ95_03970 [Candidatus Omnitrophica bacterium]|nr:hypothetical protein [Candidatus Omnitrophota bacterium]
MQILIVALMVFAYTQAIRQLRHRGELRDRLKEQLTVCRDQLARHGRRPDVAALQKEVAGLKSGLISTATLGEVARQLEELAGKEYGVRELEVKVGERPAQTLTVPLDGRLDFEAHLHALELSGVATTRDAAALLAAMRDPSTKLLASLVSMEMKRSGPKESGPARVSLRWLLAVSPSATGTALPGGPLKAPPEPEWGWRQEAFSSPLEHRGALKVPAGQLSRFRLTGIVWDEKAPTCVINGTALRPGDAVAGYRVALITERAVLLDGPEGEILLHL